MNGYRTFKTTMGRKVRVKMSDGEIIEREVFALVMVLMPLVMCWVFAAVAGMLR